jgi:ADP-heptose:LPS heptosyltransferase
MSTLIPKRVLFIATRQIGDVLVTTPLISKARELWPNAEFQFLRYRGKLDKLYGNPDIAQIITYLKISNTSKGLLMNFNVAKLIDGVKRISNE